MAAPSRPPFGSRTQIVRTVLVPTCNRILEHHGQAVIERFVRYDPFALTLRTCESLVIRNTYRIAELP